MGANRTLQRLYLRTDLAAGAEIELDRGQANYLVNVLRMPEGGRVLAFNGRDGEWRAELAKRGKRDWTLVVAALERGQTKAPGLRYLFAPLKHGRLDYMVQKATEMGAGRLTPVLTQYGQVKSLNRQRMEANTIEAAEQCGLLSVPSIDDPEPLAALLDAWPSAEPGRRIVFCDEASEGGDPVATLGRIAGSPVAVLVGPEGGFSPEERDRLRSLDFVTPIGLGPRILRADTAAVAALAIVQAAIGDWRREPAAPG